MLNWRLLTPRNIIIIGLIAVGWHIALAPIMASIAKPQAGASNDQ